MAVTITIKGADQTAPAFSGVIEGLEGIGGAAASAGEQTTGFFSGMLQSAGGFLAANVIGGIASGFGEAAGAGLSFNNSMEQVTAKLNAFTKDGAQSAAILDMIKTRAAQTPFAFEEMAQATTALMPAAKQSGVALEELISKAEILAASNPAEGLEGAAFALKEAVGGDFTSIIERFNLPRQYINQLKEQGVPALEAVGKAMEQLGLDSSLVTNMANTAEGRWSTFTDTLTNLAATVSKPIFDLWSSSLAKVNTILDANMPALQAFAEMLATKIGSVIEWLASTVIPGLISAWQAIQPAVSAAAGALMQIWGVFSEIGGAAVGWGANIVQQLAGGILQGAASVVDALSYVGSIISYWLTPGSPPPLLPELTNWGAGAASAYMDGWTKPDNFKALDEMAGIVDSVLQGLVDTGALGELDRIPFLENIKTGLAKAITEVRDQGDVLADTWDTLGAQLDQIDPNLRDVVSAYLDLADATGDAEEAQRNLDAITARYKDRLDELKAQIDQVNDAADQDTKPIDDQLAAIDVQQDALDLEQARQKLAEMRSDGESTAAEIREQELRIQRMELEAQKKAIEANRDTQIDAIEQQISQTEQARDQEVAAAQEQVTQANARKQAAQEVYDVEKGRIDQINKQNDLIAEQARLVEAAAKAAAGGGGGGGGAGGGLALPKLPQPMAQPATEETNALSDALDGLNDKAQEANETVSRFSQFLGDTFAPVADSISGIVLGIGQSIQEGIAQSAPALDSMAAAWQGTASAVGGVLSTLWSLIQSVLGSVRTFIEQHGTEIVASFVTTWASVQTFVAQYLTAIMGIIQPILAQIAQFWQAHGDEVMALVNTAWQGIMQIVQTAIAILNATIIPALQAIGGFISSHSSEIQAVLSSAWNIISTVVTTAINTIKGILTTVLQAIQGDWSGAWETLKTTSADLVQGIVDVITENINLLEGIFDLAFGDALDAVGTYITPFVNMGSDLISGMVDGIKKKASDLINAAIKVVEDAIQAAKDAIKIKSPSRRAADEIGVPFAQGIAEGIAAGTQYIFSVIDDMSDDMLKKVEDLGQAVAELMDKITTDNFAAGVGFAGLALDNERAIDEIEGDGAKRVSKLRAEYDDLTKKRDAAANNAALAKTDSERQRFEAERRALEQELRDKQTEILSTERIRDQRLALANETKKQLDDARAEADQLRETNPEGADELYSLRSKYIMGQAKLQAEMIDARNSGKDTDGLLREQTLLQQKYQAELDKLNYNLQNHNPYEDLQHAVYEAQQAVNDEGMNNPNNINWEFMQEFVKQFEQLRDVLAKASPTYALTINTNAPYEPIVQDYITLAAMNPPT